MDRARCKNCSYPLFLYLGDKFPNLLFCFRVTVGQMVQQVMGETADKDNKQKFLLIISLYTIYFEMLDFNLNQVRLFFEG